MWKAEILLLSFPCTFDLWEGEEEAEEEEEKEKEGGELRTGQRRDIANPIM